jgi:hypothetical protein
MSRTAVARRNEALDTITDDATSGLLRIYDGSRPTNADTALSGNTLLATLTMGSTAFASASGGVLTANAITSDSSADATGTASFARLWESDGTTPIEDYSVGVGSGEVQLNTLSIVEAAVISCSSMTITFPVGA